MESNEGHTSSAKKKKSNISNIVFVIPPSVRSLTSADYCASPLTRNTTLPTAGTSHTEKSPH